MNSRRLSITDKTVITVRDSFPKYFWIIIAILCLFSSIFVQFSLPFIQELLKSTLCLNPILNDSTKKLIGCMSSTIEKRTIKRPTTIERITYFDEPFPVEPWSRDEESSDSSM